MSRRAERLPGGWLRLPDGTLWPSVERARDTEWALRYGTVADSSVVLAAASIVGAYRDLVTKTPERAAYALRRLRADDRRRRRGE